MSAKRKDPEKPKKESSEPDAVDSSVGKALRNVYQKAVEEQVPPEMLDLLNKLK